MDAIEYDDEYFEGAIRYWHKISYPEFSSFLLENVPKSLNSALDLGCGDGFYGELLKKRASRLVGCDSSKTARKSLLRNRYYDRFIFMDIEAEAGTPDDVDETFDLVFTSEVIEHLEDYRKLIRFVYQLIDCGGKFILTTTTYHFYLFYYLIYSNPFQVRALTEFVAGMFDEKKASIFVRYLWNITGGHHHGFIRRRLLSSLENEGFLINAVRYANVQPVFPTDNLGNKNELYTLFLKGIGKAINRFFKSSGIYGPNILVAATKK